MQISEKKEIRQLLRDNRAQRRQLKTRRESLKADANRLREERKVLLEKADKLGIVLGKKRQKVWLQLRLHIPQLLQ